MSKKDWELYSSFKVHYHVSLLWAFSCMYVILPFSETTQQYSVIVSWWMYLSFFFLSSSSCSLCLGIRLSIPCKDRRKWLDLLVYHRPRPENWQYLFNVVVQWIFQLKQETIYSKVKITVLKLISFSYTFISECLKTTNTSKSV